MGAVVCSCLLIAFYAELGRLERFDRAVQGFVHARTTPVLWAAAVALTGVGAIRTWLPAVGLVCAFLRDRRAYWLAGSMAGALLLNEAAKLLFHRARPAVEWALGDEHTYSFPSGHALFSVVLYGTLAVLYRRGGWVAAVLALLIGASRVVLGEHWPTDVLAGWAAGLVWVLAVWRAERARDARG